MTDVNKPTTIMGDESDAGASEHAPNETCNFAGTTARELVPEEASDSDVGMETIEPAPEGTHDPDVNEETVETALKEEPSKDMSEETTEIGSAEIRDPDTHVKSDETAATDQTGICVRTLTTGDAVVSYLEIMRRKQSLFKKRLEEYLSNPGEDQIHNLRTSTRRMEATYDALPNSSKTPESKQFMSMTKSLFKKNSKLRDCDVMASMLLKFGVQKDSVPIRDLEADKTKGLEATLAAAKNLTILDVPEILATDTEKTIRKHRRSILSLLDDVRAMLPVVARDESKVGELHSMRKKIKRLRYLLEDELDGDLVSGLLEEIKLIQEIMGDIHDYDITIQYVLDNPEYFSQSAILFVAMQRKREQFYRRLVG